ncbi:hypothetical protein I6N90_09760 [Paenibacillus sp. GSMTC-2017]|uniref:hypothetical protein n=1 Tax=Paenibacillus sp. GSMTC-2017 TaxID=2794350 RepID=UPI0018D5F8E7|nr:hypothetical protein [Paenibacillus sp. GSMTC-2017]MBH5318092.1 hypothetical protein [Paenibacillus sp. GSMTC-2017]
MFWTAVWFVVNMIFVTSAIVTLFMQRAYTEGKSNGANPERLQVLKFRRQLFIIVTVILFVAMCASFVINMKING